MKIIFGIIAAILGIVSFIPYFRDIFRKKTTPHAYSWLIWSILQAIGVVSILSASGGYLGVASIAPSVVLCFFIFLLSFRFGTKHIALLDKISFAGASRLSSRAIRSIRSSSSLESISPDSFRR